MQACMEVDLYIDSLRDAIYKRLFCIFSILPNTKRWDRLPISSEVCGEFWLASTWSCMRIQEACNDGKHYNQFLLLPVYQ
jgi:hypothetical protein